MALDIAPPDVDDAAALEAAAHAAKDALAAEWRACAPTTPGEIARFYRTSQAQGPDQAAWHTLPSRRACQQGLLQTVAQTQPQVIVDIGCGSGYDLQALRAALPAAQLHGVEPNIYQSRAAAVRAEGATIHGDLSDAPLEDADLLICIDVLEHVPEPEAFLSGIARRAKLGAFLYESTATHDRTTPLHLKANAGWHPGHCLDQHGWSLVSAGGGRNRVWRRDAVAAPPRASLLLCAYRAVTVPTLNSILGLVGAPSPGSTQPWRFISKYNDGLIARSRSILISRWWAECADDVALFIDDDVIFSPEDAARVVELARERQAIVCGAYPVGDCTHFALRPFDDVGVLEFYPDAEPVEIQYGATGFCAIPRAVIDALMPTLPWVHEDQEWAFKTLFDLQTVPMGDTLAYISEDWGLSIRARAAGFSILLDPRVKIGHLKETELNVVNMNAMAAAMKVGS